MDITAIANKLEVGETHRDVCPYCKAAHEHSFAVYRTEEGAYYKCHRASCGERGRIFGSSVNVASGTTNKKPVENTAFRGRYWRADEASQLDDFDHLLKSYERELIRDEAFTAPVYYVPELYVPKHSDNLIGPGLMWPLCDSWGEQWGWEGRPIVRTYPKRVRFVEENGHHLHWANPGAETRPIIVEDWWSAEVLSHYGFNSVALLGATLNRGAVQEICKNGFRKVTLWLDSDAAAAEARIVKEWDGILDIYRPKRDRELPDPKYLSKGDIVSVLKGEARS